jgi:hypothetical protein
LCLGDVYNSHGYYGESAGARTQDQRLKRAMLYQLSYALRPLYKVSTVEAANLGQQRDFALDGEWWFHWSGDEERKISAVDTMSG